MIRFGVFLMIVSIVAFVGFMVAPIASADVRKALEPYICGEGETLEVSVYRYRPGETSYSLYCEGDGETTSTDGLILISMLVFFAALGVSILFIIWGSVSLAGKQQAKLRQSFGQMMTGGEAQIFGFDVGDGSARTARRNVQIDLSDPNNPVVRRDTPDDGGNSNDSLAEKLRELQAAFDAGLLTQEEYDSKRQKILDKF
jgi:hypothetical protein